jgi:DNA gyrase subunit B
VRLHKTITKKEIMAENLTTSYESDDMQVLEGLDAVRKRPGMYIGSTDSKGITHLVNEVGDNSVDESIAGHAKHLGIKLFSDGSVQVEDDGRGIPTGLNKKVGLTGVEIAYQKLHGGGKFGGSGYKSAGGLHGVGASVVNALSTRLDVTVYRENKEHTISFRRGEAGIWAEDGPTGKFTPKKGLIVKPDKRSAAEKKARPTGTTVRWWADPTIFIAGSEVDAEYIFTRARQTAFLVSGLTVTVKDERNAEAVREESFFFEGGIVDMVDHLTEGNKTTDIISIKGEGNYKETVPVLNDSGNMVSTEVEREAVVDVALGFSDGYETVLRSFVNVVNTPEGGTHVAGFERAITKVVLERIKSTRGLMKANEPAPILDDIKEGLNVVVSVGISEPQFLGQTKEKLGTPAVAKIVQTVVTDGLNKWFDNKKTAASSKLVLQKIVDASRNRIAARTLKDTNRKKSALESSSSMPAKLVSCAISDPLYTELQICEGDSALGGLKNARDSGYQAIYPLKGKPLNSHGLPLSKVLENQEWSDLIQIIGAGVGKSFDLEQMNYRRIIMLADADADGSHIRTLLIAFFWKFMRPLVEDGRLFSALPPLFSVTTTGKTKEKFFALNEEELGKITSKLDAQKKGYGKIQRHKGLGEYDDDVLASEVMDPATRALRKITVPEGIEAERVIELAMGGNALNRREWIIATRAILSDDDIDI